MNAARAWIRDCLSIILKYLPGEVDGRGKTCEMKAEANRRAVCERAYAMKKHHATRLHYDLRLEWNGVLLSWALPEGPSCCSGAIRRAIEVEDHRRANLSFEGLHETGPIMLWDRGTWEPQMESDDIHSALHNGVLRFTLHGEKLKGGWTLARINGSGDVPRPVWTLSKQADSFAAKRADKCILEIRPNSISTGKSMEEIVREWTAPKDKHEWQTKLFDEI
jgi:bifunctional non-homologous end joining protein LigD